MKATHKKATLDSFVRGKLEGVVKKYACYGLYQAVPQCRKCSVKKQCKEASH